VKINVSYSRDKIWFLTLTPHPLWKMFLVRLPVDLMVSPSTKRLTHDSLVPPFGPGSMFSQVGQKYILCPFVANVVFVSYARKLQYARSVECAGVSLLENISLVLCGGEAVPNRWSGNSKRTVAESGVRALKCASSRLRRTKMAAVTNWQSSAR